MNTANFTEFEVIHNGFMYMIDFDVDYHIVKEARTYDYPGYWELIIDDITVISCEYFDEETNSWIESELSDEDIIGILELHDQKIKDQLR